MSETQNRVRSIFLHAVENVPPERWAAYLDGVCGDDPDLRGRVQALLEADQRADSLLDGPEPTDPPGPPAEGPGTVIGPYTLLEILGEGGMGVVFLAEQARPVRRKVALKIIKPGMDTRQVIARFEAERQALALMDHPSIAKVLDAGATDTGRPYFAMELVEGVPITTHCDTMRLTPRERLELFIPVCQAIQHAHQKGIVHRDIKPSNVMMTMVDGKPVAKVIDFGVAKAIDQRLTERSLFTQQGAIVGTFEYMSPEQAELSGLDIDTRSDIYALGVLLYELLAGSTPLEQARVRQAAYSEIIRLIREEEPPKPSTRLSDSGDRLASLAARRRTEPARLAKQVRGELDWIVMKAIDKDRNRRYETANGFSRDIQRHLDGDPVEAGPPSAWYKLRKFVRKYRGSLATTGAFIVLLIIAAVVSTWQAVRATRAEGLAEKRHGETETARKATQAALEQSEEARRQADEVSDFMVEAFRSTNPGRGEGDRDIKVADLLGQAEERLEHDFTGSEETRGTLLDTLGQTYFGLGWFDKADMVFQRAIAVRASALGPDHLDTLASRNNLAEVYLYFNRTADAIALHKAALREREARLGPDHPDTLDSSRNLALDYWAAGRTAEAIALHEATLKRAEAALGPDHPGTIASRSHLALAYQSAGRIGEAILLHDAVLKTQESKLGPDHPDTLAARNNLANALMAAGRAAEAIPLHKATLKLIETRFGPDHHRALVGLNNLAAAYQEAGRAAEAIPLHEAALKVYESKLGHDHRDTINSRNNLAAAYLSTGRAAQAVELFEAVLKGWEARLGPDHPDSLRGRSNLAAGYEGLGRWTQAEHLLRDGLARQRKGEPPDSPVLAATLARLGRNLQKQEKWPEAEIILRECLKIREAKLPDDWSRFAAMSLLGGALLGQGRHTEAEPLIFQGYEGLKARAQQIPPPARFRLTEAANRIVRLYGATGQPHKADALLRPEDCDAMMPNGTDAFAR